MRGGHDELGLARWNASAIKSKVGSEMNSSLSRHVGIDDIPNHLGAAHGSQYFKSPDVPGFRVLIALAQFGCFPCSPLAYLTNLTL